MSEKKQGEDKRIIEKGYVPANEGYKPPRDRVTDGHKPKKSELKPVNPPKKK